MKPIARRVGLCAAGLLSSGAFLLAGCESEREAVGDSTVSVDIEIGATGIAAGGGWVWVAEAQGEHTVSRIDPVEAEFVGSPTKVNDYVEETRGDELTGDAEGVWALTRNTVTRIDSDGRVVGKPINVGIGATDLAASNGALWVARPSARELIRIDSDSREVRRIPLEMPVVYVEFGYGSAWVAGKDGTLGRLDPQTGKAEIRAVQIGESIYDLAVGEGFVWALTNTDLVRIDWDTGNVIDRVDQGEDEAATDNGDILGGDVIEIGHGALWGGGFRELTRVDAGDGSVIGSRVIGSQEDASIQGVAITPEGVWVLNSTDAEVELIEP